MNASRISRRSLLRAAAALIPSLSRAAAPARLAVIDWALCETCIALGAAPAAATELVQFRKIVVEPTLPDSVIDIGLRGTPNLELLSIVAPDLILISNFYEYQPLAFSALAWAPSTTTSLSWVFSWAQAPDPLANAMPATPAAKMQRRFDAPMMSPECQSAPRRPRRQAVRR